MALDVIGAGYGRTGTLSLKTALELLGFGPCHHMTEIINDMDRQAPMWNRVADGNERDWEMVFASYRSTVDWPGCHYYAELADAYPDARVILTVRDSRQWYASMKDTILKVRSGLLMRLLLKVSRFPMRFALKIILKQTFGYKLDETHVIAAFDRHIAEVQRRIPAERLLVFDVRQGWEPLCAFLGVPVPETPFPRTNDREMFASRAKKFRRAA